jgi:integrase
LVATVEEFDEVVDGDRGQFRRLGVVYDFGGSASPTSGSTQSPSVRRWVKEAAHAVAEQTDDPRWQSVSSHDLRRSWATYHLVERQVDVRTMMSIGG